MRIVASRSSDIRIEISGLRTSSPFRFTAPIPEFATCSLVGEEANNTITLAQQPVLQFCPEKATSPVELEECQSIQCNVDEFPPSETSKHRLPLFLKTSLLESYITPILFTIAPELTSVKPVNEPCFLGAEIYICHVSHPPTDHTLLFLERPITPPPSPSRARRLDASQPQASNASPSRHQDLTAYPNQPNSTNASLLYQLMLWKESIRRGSWDKFNIFRLASYAPQLSSRPYLCTPLAALGFVPLRHCNAANTDVGAESACELGCCGCALRLVLVSAPGGASVADSATGPVGGACARAGATHSGAGADARLSQRFTLQKPSNDKPPLIPISFNRSTRECATLVQAFFSATHSTSCNYLQNSAMEFPKNQSTLKFSLYVKILRSLQEKCHPEQLSICLA